MSVYSFQEGEARPERRGGARSLAEAREIRLSMIHHISKFKVDESHYGREKSRRQYLQCDLTISKMFAMWLEERQAADLPAHARNKSVFYNVFHRSFNLSFRHPRTDVCAKCRDLKAGMNVGTPEEREVKRCELKLHEASAKRFYALVREESKRRDTLLVNFDLQKTLPLPRTNISDAFYKRQMWLYNLGIVIRNNSKRAENCYSYSWIHG